MFITNVTLSPTLILPVTIAVLLIVKLTATTFTVALSLTLVLFSLDVTLTVLFHVPIAIERAIIHSSVELPLAKLGIVQVISLPLVTFPVDALTATKPFGNTSRTVT